MLRNIRLGARIEGLVRKEEYELPLDAIRKMIVNAHCHRNFRDESCVQVAIYDDRLEVSSPGGLYNGLTFEDALRGRSRLRNRAIANVFSQMGLIEAWGTGLQRIRDAAHEYGLPEPEFIEMMDGFRVNLYRQASQIRLEVDADKGISTNTEIGTNTETGTERAGTDTKTSTERANTDTETSTEKAGTDTEKILLDLIHMNPSATLEELARDASLSKSGVRYVLRKLRERGIVVREGAQKNGRWIIQS